MGHEQKGEESNEEHDDLHKERERSGTVLDLPEAFIKYTLVGEAIILCKADCRRFPDRESVFCLCFLLF